ncbi:cyclase family protein [Pseudonocardia sp. CA-142604]|uniref:cyclase family protein n=1 Tax=Pseudonocardia sp. CA-142604 TaxID=3240024 RepID=UPI003D92238E
MTRVDMTAREFRKLFDAVSNWDRWDGGERGALHHLTAARAAAAARLVRSGVTVTLSRPLTTEPRIDVPEPADHHMTMLTDVDIGSGSVRFAKDYIGVDYHNEGHSHIDALCHVAFDGSFFDGTPVGAVTAQGAQTGAIDALENGLVGRGVLLDVPRSRGVRWIEPGDHIFREDLEAAERQQGVRVGPGDILLVRTGHARRLSELGPWDTREAKAGLHPTAAMFLAERRIAALGSDGNNDTAPSTTEGIGFPIHVLAINAMGVHLLDYLQFEDVVPQSEATEQWEFCFVATPLRITGGTGSPLNPIAIF